MTDDSHQLVKRFIAPTMTRALELVQKELGPEAVILSSRQVKKGVEIVTSLEPDLPTRGIDVRRNFGQKFDTDLDTAMSSDMAWRSQSGIEKAAAQFGGQTEINSGQHYQRKPPAELAKEIEKAREKMFAAKRQAQLEGESCDNSNQHGISQPQHRNVNRNAQTYVETNEDSDQLETLKHELADMRMLLEQQLWQMSQSNRPMTGLSIPDQIKMPTHFVLLSEHLSKLGLSAKLVEELVGQTQHHHRASVAWRECMAILSKRIPTCDEPILKNAGIYAFVGQTGVGKTTTIAKLAAQYVMKHGPGKVALVTTDTHRVGAFDQLRTMGRILNVPVKIVDRENSLLTVLSTLRQFPMVLIDTAGFRLGDPLLKAQLNELESSSVLKRVLVLSCNSQLATMKASVHAHRGKRGLYGCILTKLDESATIGEAISLVVDESLPLSYTTDGQDIPKDIVQASAHGLVAKAVALSKEYANKQNEHAAL